MRCAGLLPGKHKCRSCWSTEYWIPRVVCRFDCCIILGFILRKHSHRRVLKPSEHSMVILSSHFSVKRSHFWLICNIVKLLWTSGIILKSINCKLYQITFCVTRIYQLWRWNFDVNVSSMQPTAHKVQTPTAVKKILDIFRRPLGGWICLRGKGRTYVVGPIMKG